MSSGFKLIIVIIVLAAGYAYYELTFGPDHGKTPLESVESAKKP